MWKEARIAIKLWKRPLLVRKGNFISMTLNPLNVNCRAMATHESELVEPTVELGRRWLEIEAKRNCRQDKTLLGSS